MKPTKHFAKTAFCMAALLMGALAWGAIPLADPPQPLRDKDGKPETGLVDPFVPRGAAEDPEMPGSGLTRTAAGELPADFRILAISIPVRGEPTALVRMAKDEEPTLVREGDQIRVPRADPRRRGRAATPDPNARTNFYLYVKTITPTYIEVYHTKTRPDDTQILRW